MTRQAKRILFVTESFGVGGTETHLLDLLPELKARGFDVAAFCFTEKGTRASKLEAEAIPIYAAPDVGDQRKRSWRAPFRMAGGMAKLLVLIKRFRPTIIHFFLGAPYILGAPVSILTQVPIKILSRRGLNDYQRNWPGAAFAEQMLHGRMDALSGNAKALTKELIAEGAPEEKVHLIYNGVKLADSTIGKEEARAALGIDPKVGPEFDTKTLVAVVVANLHAYKGHLDLVAGFAEIAGRLPKPWVVLLAGLDCGSQADIEKAIVDAHLEDNISLLGERSDIPSLLAAADFGLLTPTRNEGFSNAILESMAAGLPMVVTDIGGNAEAVEDGKTGFVVPAHDPKALGASILKLALDPARRKAMGTAARERAMEQFSLTKQIDQYEALYTDLLAQHERAD